MSRSSHDTGQSPFINKSCPSTPKLLQRQTRRLLLLPFHSARNQTRTKSVIDVRPGLIFQQIHKVPPSCKFDETTTQRFESSDPRLFNISSNFFSIFQMKTRKRPERKIRRTSRAPIDKSQSACHSLRHLVLKLFFLSAAVRKSRQANEAKGTSSPTSKSHSSLLSRRWGGGGNICRKSMALNHPIDPTLARQKSCAPKFPCRFNVKNANHRLTK